MLPGLTLTALAAEIERQAESKRDFLASTSKVEMIADEQAMETFKRLMAQPVTRNRREAEAPEVDVSTAPVRLSLSAKGGREVFGVRKLAHSQIAQKLEIPENYYRRIATEHPDLYLDTVNHLLHDSQEKRLIRVLDGHVRAYLADGYRPLEYFDLLEVILPVIQRAGLKILSCNVTETRLYLKAVNERVQGKVVGDIVQAGLMFSDSEVGRGALDIQPLVLRLKCMNGAIGESLLRKIHLGRRSEDTGTEAAYEMFTDDTKAKTDAALWAQVHDITQTALHDQNWFDKQVARMNESAEAKITGDVPAAVEELRRVMPITQEQKSGILRHLIEGGDLSKWGLANAVTRFAQDVKDYDTSTELEELGMKVVELPQPTWDRISQAKPLKQAKVA